MTLFGICRIFLYLSLAGLALSSGSGIQHSSDASRNEYLQDPSYYFYQQSEYPKDCYEVHSQCLPGNSSGVYLIKPEGYLEPFEVQCENTQDSGGWTVIQRRTVNGSVSFNRDWESYKHGFGFLAWEFWIGNEKLSYLTSQKKYQLLVEMTSSDGTSFHVSYSNFRISDVASKYKLVSLDQYGGDVDHITWCPDDLHYGNCTCGRRTCESPDLCLDTCAVDVPDYCVPCPEGFYMKGVKCVSRSECGCYVKEDRVVVPEGEVYVTVDCSERFLCHDGRLTSSEYRCSANAICGIQDGVRGCYCGDGYLGDNIICLPLTVARDCHDLLNAGYHENGVYSILPKDWPWLPFPVYCNMNNEGGWTVFQRRVDGAEDFNLDWANYKRGFGNLSHEFWLGNDKLFYLTNQREYEIMIDLVDRDGTPYHANYTAFRISNEEDNYRITNVGTYSGTTGADKLTWHLNKPFSTHDRDNDGWNDHNCAEQHQGGWWFAELYTQSSTSNCRTYDNYCEYFPDGSRCVKCAYSYLNADHDSGTRGRNISWESLPGFDCSVQYTEMKLRPVNP